MQFEKRIKLLIIAEQDGEISREEQAILDSWISESEPNRRYYEQTIVSLESSLNKISVFAQTTSEWKRFLERISASPVQQHRSVRNFRWYYAAVVVILVLIVLGVGIFKMHHTNEIKYYTFSTPKGTVNHVILPDSSIVYLNSGSEIKYDISSKHKLREVYLTGEAWFHVKKDTLHPFIVHTPFYNVKVLGTKFNVNSYSGQNAITTTLEEGSIQIDGEDVSGQKQSAILHPGEQIRYEKKEKKFYKTIVDAGLFTSWRENQLIYSDMEFRDLIKLLEDKYNVQIEVNDSTLLKEHYSGSIKDETIVEIMDIIQYTHPVIQYHIQGDKIIINKK